MRPASEDGSLRRRAGEGTCLSSGRGTPRGFRVRPSQSWKSKVRARADPVSGGSTLPGSWTALLPLRPHAAEEMRELSGPR